MTKPLYLLDGLEIIEIAGDDCIDFLHKQFCNDLRALAVGESQLSAHCNIKGRVQAMFILHRLRENTVWMIIDKAVAANWLNKLRMYVMRSQVAFKPLRLNIYGSLEGSMEVFSGNATQIALPGIQRCHFYVSDETTTADPADENWAAAMIQDGIPLFGAANQDQYLPQMWSLDLVNGMSFNKGCYPGQEIVIRTAHKGQLKKRLMALTGASLAQAEELETADGESAAEIIAQIQHHDGVLIQAIVKLEHADKTLTDTAGNEFEVSNH